MLFIYQLKVKKNWAKQWAFYKTQITKILNEAFSIEKTKNCTNFGYLLMPKLSPTLFYFLLLPPFQLGCHLELDLGQLVWEKQKKELDYIATKVPTKSIQVAPNTTKTATKIVHPSTLCTIVKIEKRIENLQLSDGTGVALMVEQIVFW